VRDAGAVGERWRFIAGGSGGVEVVEDEAERGLVEVRIAGARAPFTAGGVQFVPV
jgi:hypothetical protein